MDGYNICEICTGRMQFLRWRGLSLMMKCPKCGHIQADWFPYKGFEANLVAIEQRSVF